MMPGPGGGDRSLPDVDAENHPRRPKRPAHAGRLGPIYCHFFKIVSL